MSYHLSKIYLLNTALCYQWFWLDVSVTSLFFSFPGHSDNQLSPIYIPEHYGERSSQHLFDPYSFVHFGHGILSFYVFGFFDGDLDLIWGEDNTRFNFKEDRPFHAKKIKKSRPSGIGESKF